jgi:F-type H+-transporting ATPase subunit epsilon
MMLKVWVPNDVRLDEEVTKIKAEAEDGWFCILPRHVDFVTALVPGILSFDRPGGATEYLAIDHGVLVKCGGDVSVSTRSAIPGDDLEALRETVEKRFLAVREKEQATREVEAKLETALVRGLLEIEKHAAAR